MAESSDGVEDDHGSSPDDDQTHLHRPGAEGLNRRRTIIGAIVAIVFLVIVFSQVVPRVGDYSAAFEALGQLSLGSLLILAAVLPVYLFIYGWPYVVATPGLSYAHSSIVNNSRFAIGNGIPAGGALGLGVQYAQLTFYGASPTAATAAIGATGVWATFVTVTLPITGVAALIAGGQDIGTFIYAAVVGLLILIAMIAVFALILRSEANAERIGRLGDRVVGWVMHRFGRASEHPVSAQILQLRHDIVDLVRSRWILITVTNFAVSLGQFLILATALNVVAHSQGESVNLWAAYGAWAVSQVGILVPVTSGGLGTVDAAIIALLTATGTSEAVATAGTLLWRATYYFPQIILGVICVFIWRWQAERARRATERSA